MRPSAIAGAFRALGAAPLALAMATNAFAALDEATIRQRIAAAYPAFPKIDEVNRTAIPGLYEVRIGSNLFYSDATGEYMLDGSLVETRSHRNLTEARLDQVTAIDVHALDLHDALVWRKGNGQRHLVVFADPNCSFCRHLEQQLQSVDNVTVHTFLYPVLGSDSLAKAKAIWCAKDSAATWHRWMLKGAPIPNDGTCDVSALQRNIALGVRHRINGTPALIFEDGKRAAGAMERPLLEKQLVASAAGKR